MSDSIDYTVNTPLFKALGDENRLKIIDMLANGEICACEILWELEIAQPTLSHHMKILCDCSLVIPRREGKWTYYSLNKGKVKEMKAFINTITDKKGHYVTKKKGGCCE